MGFSTVSAYVIGGVSMLVMLAIAVLIANFIKYQIGENRTDITKRRIWFWIMAICVPVVTFVICFFMSYRNLRIPNQMNQYFTAMCISAAVFFVLYIVFGILLSSLNKKGKIGDWFKF